MQFYRKSTPTKYVGTNKKEKNNSNPLCLGLKQNLIGLFCILPYIYTLLKLLVIIIIPKMQKSPIRFQNETNYGYERFFCFSKITKHLLIRGKCYTCGSEFSSSAVSTLRPRFSLLRGLFFARKKVTEQTS